MHEATYATLRCAKGSTIKNMDTHELATKQELQTSLHEVWQEVADQGLLLHGEIADQGKQLRKETAEQGAQLRREMANMKQELRQEIKDAVGLVLEKMDDNNRLIMEVLVPVKQKTDRIPKIEADIEDIKIELSTMKAALTATNTQVRDHEQRIDKLESATA